VIKAGGTFPTADGVTMTSNFVNVVTDGGGKSCTQTNTGVTFSH
jgi:hypothetical protein